MASSDNKHQCDGESCDDGESFHQYGPQSSTDNTANAVEERVADPVPAEHCKVANTVTEPALKVAKVKSIPDCCCITELYTLDVPRTVPVMFVCRMRIVMADDKVPPKPGSK